MFKFNKPQKTPLEIKKGNADGGKIEIKPEAEAKIASVTNAPDLDAQVCLEYGQRLKHLFLSRYGSKDVLNLVQEIYKAGYAQAVSDQIPL